MAGRNKFRKDNSWRYTTDRQEPLTALLNLRITEKQKEQIKKVPNWQELLRDSIDTIIQNNIDCT
ncbi:MAG: hypothetical protein AAF316_03535 [Cyanobacteria bacterium P01_A01_bin.80]